MHLPNRLTALAMHPRLPRRTVRLRLTALYGGLFLVSGATLLAIYYALVVHATSGFIFTDQNGHTISVVGHTPEPGRSPRPISTESGTGGSKPPGDVDQLQALASRQHEAVLHQLLTQSGVALAVMAVVSVALGWFVAGRVLRRLRTITAMVRDISATSLHRRLALEGPDDELTELGRTFDSLLARLEAAFQAQRQFVANASHELRTPLARQRTVAQVALADPGATVDSLRTAHERVLASGEEQERLIEALLTLAHGQAGTDKHERFDLATLSRHLLDARRTVARRRRLDVRATLRDAPASGDRHLVERLIANLVDNALCHNTDLGRVDVTTTTRSGHAVLSVVNTGPIVPAAALDRLRQPFQRLDPARTRHRKGLGLGLSIVQAIATAHQAGLDVQARETGGLAVEITFPATDPHDPVPTCAEDVREIRASP